MAGDGGDPPPRQKLGLAPISITPTKPLTPSHVKGLLWLDVIHRATSELAEATYVWNSRTPNLSAQTLEFWEYLDRVAGERDWSQDTEIEIGNFYLRLHAERQGPLEFALLAPYLERVESSGWVHPASRRLIELWSEQFRLLGLHDPGLSVDRAPGLSADEALAVLAESGMLIDHRPFGGPVYLDGPRWGLPLRQVVGADGHANYVLGVLRELIPLVGRQDRLLLVFDPELAEDYVLIDRVLCAFGAAVSRLAISRVPLEGVIQTSRRGGWKGNTLAELARLCLEQFGAPAYRLGMRLYFIAVLKRSSPQSFRLDLLRRSLIRAQRIIDRAEPGAGDQDYLSFLEGMVNDDGFIDPHRLTTSLLDRHRTVPINRMIHSVYL